MSKVTVVGAGNVGATCANVLAVKQIASEVVLIDIKEGVAEGKAMDIMQTAQLSGADLLAECYTYRGFQPDGHHGIPHPEIARPVAQPRYRYGWRIG